VNRRFGGCHVLTLVPRSRIFLPWRWRPYIPLRRRFTQDLHGATSRKTAFFRVTAVKTSNLTTFYPTTSRNIPENGNLQTVITSQITKTNRRNVSSVTYRCCPLECEENSVYFSKSHVRFPCHALSPSPVSLSLWKDKFLWLWRKVDFFSQRPS
jgi:hypothetical protein